MIVDYVRFKLTELFIFNPYAAGGLILPKQNNAKNLKNHRNPGKWVLI